MRAITRREFVKRNFIMGSLINVKPCYIIRSQPKLKLSFKIIPDPDGWHPSLKLKGDWILVCITNGEFTAYGEISHSKSDKRCMARTKELFAAFVEDISPSLDSIQKLMDGPFSRAQDFVTATAISGLNQALIELIAKREGVPVWKLFTDTPKKEKVMLYTTINRALQTRELGEYLDVVEDLVNQGFQSFKCAPFEKVMDPLISYDQSDDGLDTLSAIRKSFPGLGLKVDFHERFDPLNFFRLLPKLEEYNLDWIEEPFPLNNDYKVLKQKTTTPVAGGELFFGIEKFSELVRKEWVDVIMPDIKHVGGFSSLLELCANLAGNVRVSPHNPSGPVSTAASLHCAVLSDQVDLLEFPFDRNRHRIKIGEVVIEGYIHLTDKPGWGLNI